MANSGVWKPLWQRCVDACAPAPLWTGLRDKVVWGCFAASLTGLFFEAKSVHNPAWFLLAPFVEELTWRVLIQEEVCGWLKNAKHGRLADICSAFGADGIANTAVSSLFALAHVAAIPGVLSALTFFPSLLFGFVWARHHSLILCALLHLACNTAFVL